MPGRTPTHILSPEQKDLQTPHDPCSSKQPLTHGKGQYSRGTTRNNICSFLWRMQFVTSMDDGNAKLAGLQMSLAGMYTPSARNLYSYV